MRYLILFLILILCISSCDKRECRCEWDMNATWEGGNSPEDLYYEMPTGVVHEGYPMSMAIYRVNSLGENYNWEIQKAKLYNGNTIFLESNTPEAFKVNEHLIQFPHELFIDSKGNAFTGKINVELSIYFNDFDYILHFVGSIFRYSCEEVRDEDFSAEDCIWPSQILSSYQNVLPQPCN